MPVRLCRYLVGCALVVAVFAAGPTSPLLAQPDAQPYTLSGTVVEAQTGDPLPGANVQLQGRTVGTATESDGTFELDVRLAPGDYVVVVSFLGYATTRRSVSLGDESDVDLGTVELRPDVTGLDEVVVTGTGAPTERKRLGTAIETVDGGDLEQAPATSIDQALQGKIAGANIQQNSGRPAGGMSIRLRGASTVLGDANPLIIVDGVVVSNDSPELIDLGGTTQNRLVDLNPNDIARIEVVKGAAAAALYGSRANNGVVQIFTKRGRSGAPRATFSTRLMTSNVRKTLDVNMARNENGQFLDNSGNPLPDGGRRYDWQEFIFDRGWGTEQYLSINGGDESTQYVFSGSHYVNEGIVDTDRFRRVNGRARIDQTLTEWLNVSAGAKFAWNESSDVPNGGISQPYGALTGFIFGPNTFDPRPDEFGNYPQSTILANPVEVIDRFDFGQETRRFIGSLQASLSPSSALNVDYTLGLDTYDQVGLAFIPSGTTAPGQPQGFSRRSTQTFLGVNQDLNARYETDLTETLASTTVAGASMQYENTERFTGQSLDLPPFVRVIQAGAQPATPTEFRNPFVLYGFFAQQTLGYADRLFLTGALRLDASSSFGEGERWQLYPKVSGSYLLSDESFWQNSSLSRVLNTVKLRAALGVSGGLSAIDSFERFTLVSPSTFGGNPGLVPSSELGATEAKPERQREIEVGANLGFLNDRISTSLTYYYQNTEDLLLSRNLAPTSGFSTGLRNVGTLTNQGVEVRLQALPVSGESVEWTSTVTWSRNRNEVSNLNQDLIQFPRSFGGISAARNGEPLGFFYGTAFQRNDEGDILDRAGNPMTRDDDGFLRPTSGNPSADGYGLPAAADTSRIIGNPNPDWTGSWINEVTLWNRLSVRVQMDAVVGRDVFNFTRRLGAFGPFGTLEDYERELEGDLPSGYNTAVFGIFENWVENGSYLKLREVSLAYTISPERWPVRDVTVRLSGRNLLSIDDYSGYDPEINVAGQSTTVRGFDFVEVPLPRTFSFGVTLGI
jgi:TonB-linked SusC/RagA family outer membrane protein